MRHVVATGHPSVTAIGADVLRAGGNAFDATVACGFASTVAEPGLTSLGGGGFLLARPAGGRAALFDFFVDTPGRGHPGPPVVPDVTPITVRFPSSEQVFHTGLGSVAVPGMLRGLVQVQARLGRLPLADVVSPAARLARDGVVVNRAQGHVLGLLRAVLTATPAGRALFAPGGRYLVAGDRFANPTLGAFLAQVAREGDREFYEGAIASEIARTMRDGGGLVTAADLRAFRVVAREPLAVPYRGLRLLTNPPPSVGGRWLADALALLGTAAPGGIASGFGSAEHLTLLLAVQEEMAGRAVPAGRGGTTHASVCDAEGNVASMTSSNGECSGHLAGTTGVVLNNMLGETDLHPAGAGPAVPGERVGSMMAPSMLLDGDRVRLALGSGGSTRIRTALLQVLSNVVDFGMPVEAAVGAPRLHWDGARVQCEPGFPASATAALGDRRPLNVWPVTDVYFGGVQAVSPDGEGAGDPRRGGAAVVVAAVSRRS
jgi:gamma-glutamyltranspeptidase / glutathione hydrolase